MRVCYDVHILCGYVHMYICIICLPVENTGVAKVKINRASAAA